ncbi:MAG: hypothetical protein NY202_02605 [Mollicutes bacterium UO1]
MVTNEKKIQSLRKSLGNAHSRINMLKIASRQLKMDNEALIKTNQEIKTNLTKSEEALNTAEEETMKKREGGQQDSANLNGVEEDLKKLELALLELEQINADLVGQNKVLTNLADENKTKSSSVLTKSLAILGIFAGGAWLVVAAKELWGRLKDETKSNDSRL